VFCGTRSAGLHRCAASERVALYNFYSVHQFDNKTTIA
jgi:hypothetical protein